MILAIESSCDDTAVALVTLQGQEVESRIASQIAWHEKFGGVVPEIASRQHLAALPWLVEEVLAQAQVTKNQLKAIAVTHQPGLVGSVLVGVSVAKALAWSLNLPLVPVDHLEGHLLAPLLDHPNLQFPYLALIASGGHSHLFWVKELGDYQLLGRTLDDAAGEAYDKAAKMLGFPYPGGPVIEQLAALCPGPGAVFPFPLADKPGLDFSFSGLKTAFRNQALERQIYVEKSQLIGYDCFIKTATPNHLKQAAELAKGLQNIMETIFSKRMDQAHQQTQAKAWVLTGGVAANQGLRRALAAQAAKRKAVFYAPSLAHCMDNAAMIGLVAAKKLAANPAGFALDHRLNASAKSPLSTGGRP